MCSGNFPKHKKSAIVFCQILRMVTIEIVINSTRVMGAFVWQYLAGRLLYYLRGDAFVSSFVLFYFILFYFRPPHNCNKPSQNSIYFILFYCICADRFTYTICTAHCPNRLTVEGLRIWKWDGNSGENHHPRYYFPQIYRQLSEIRRDKSYSSSCHQTVANKKNNKQQKKWNKIK